MSAAETAMQDGHEQVVLAAMMNGRNDLPVTAADFSSPPNRTIFAAIQRLDESRVLLAVQDELQRRGQLEAIGGPPRLTNIYALQHDAADVEYALGEVLDASRQRQAITIGQQLVNGAITP